MMLPFPEIFALCVTLVFMAFQDEVHHKVDSNDSADTAISLAMTACA